MSLYVRHNDTPDQKIVEAEWNLEEPLPNVDPMKVIEMEAKGEELEYILDQFNGLIRKTPTPQVRWEGDLARIIYDTLIVYYQD